MVSEPRSAARPFATNGKTRIAMPNPPLSSSPLYLIDAMSLVFQAFYAVRGLTNAQGLPTNAVFGFTKKVQKLLSDYRPERLVAVFDSPGPTFRHEMFAEYKANRAETPEEFQVQVPYILRLLDAAGIPHLSMRGYEADDLIGTLAARAAQAGQTVVIVTADKDLFQLVNDRVKIIRPRQDDLTVFGPAEVKEKMGVGPEQIVDFLALTGDTSDNIPGVPGIGPKTAAQLLGEFGTLENLLSHAEQIKNARQRDLVTTHAETARLSYRLAKIECAAPVDLPEVAGVCAPNFASSALMSLYRELGFTSLVKEARQKQAAQADFFGETDAAVSQIPGDGKQAASPSGPTVSHVVWDRKSLESLIKRIRKAGRVALDTETTDLDPMRAALVGISLCCEPGSAYYIPVGHRLEEDAGRQLPQEVVREALGPVLADKGVIRIAQNAKFDLRVLRRHGFPAGPVHFDTMLASYVLNPEGRHGLKSLALELLGMEMTEIEALIGKGKNATTMDLVEIVRVAPYACADADMTFRLADVLGERLRENGLTGLFEEIEMPLVEVLDAMESEGVTLDTSVLDSLSRSLGAKIDTIAADVFRIAGRSFNIKSTQQVADVLFRDLGLKPKRKTATGLSTSSEVLEELRESHPLPARILDYRHLEKILSTYVEALPRMVHPETGRIHTSYNQFIAATGRLSSSNPNLQNIPVRSVEGREIRRAFVPNHRGDVFLAADYSQIELRVLAHLSKDSELRRAFLENRDIHSQTAARIFGTPSDMVTEEMRSQAKVINFGILYGMGPHRLSRELSISHAQAGAFIEEYFRAYPGVREWIDKTIEEARRTGYVSTLSGRRRMIANMNSSNHNLRSNAERMAVNTPVQGTAADMVKFAMIALHQEIESSGRRARMVLQVHDELVFSLPEEEVEEFEPVVRERMQEALPLDVPLRVDTKTGRTWAEC